MKRTPIKYSPEQLKFVKSNCTLTRAELTKQFNERFALDLSVSNIASLCKRNKWFTGRTGRYELGNVPSPNSGAKGPNKTSFKKGNRPHNWVPLGSEVTTTEGYVQVKIAEPNVWKLKSLIVWEKEHGCLLPGQIIRFIDNDPQNCELSNLESVSKALNLRLNQNRYRTLPNELKPTMKAIATLEVAAFSRVKTNQEKTNVRTK